jgi:hypothetical protein
MNRRPEPTLFLADTPAMREHVEAAIESLLQLLDALDSDPDLEPSLGAPEVGLPDVIGFVPNRFRSTTQEHWSDGRGDLEEEEQHDAEYDPAEAGYVAGEV